MSTPKCINKIILYFFTFDIQIAISVTLTCELTMTPCVSMTLTFTNVVNGPIFKLGSQIERAMTLSQNGVSRIKNNFNKGEDESKKWFSAFLCHWKLTFQCHTQHMA